MSYIPERPDWSYENDTWILPLPDPTARALLARLRACGGNARLECGRLLIDQPGCGLDPEFLKELWEDWTALVVALILENRDQERDEIPLPPRTPRHRPNAHQGASQRRPAPSPLPGEDPNDPLPWEA